MASVEQHLRSECEAFVLPALAYQTSLEAGPRRSPSGRRNAPPRFVTDHVEWMASVAQERCGALIDSISLCLQRYAAHCARRDWPFERRATIDDLRFLGAETHQGSQTILSITPCQSAPLVYKPVSLSPDRLYGEITSVLLANGSDACGQFCTKQDFAGGPGYGFRRYLIEAGREGSPCDLRQFARRCGELLATAYCLQITDQHFENVMVCNGWPVLVDLETAFYRYPAETSTNVLSTGLLQRRRPDRQVSGFQGRAGVPHFGVFPTENSFGDLHLRFIGVDKRRNGPDQALLRSPSYKHSEEVVAGFRKGYGLIGELSSELKALIVGAAPGLKTRQIVRPTAYYMIHLLCLRRPHQDGVAGAIGAAQVRLAQDPALERLDASVLSAELEDLLHGDVPYFSTRASDASLTNGRRLVTSQYFARDGIEDICHRLTVMSEDDCDTQSALIEQTLMASPDS
jgi:lantibiotic modifying enzyme